MTQLEKHLWIIGSCCSATITGDIADWIGAKNVFNFTPVSRTFPLNLVIQSYEHNCRASKLFAMSKPIYTAIKSYAPTSLDLIVIPDRKTVKTLALDLIPYASAEHFKLPDSTCQCSEKTVEHALKHGVCILSEGFSTKSLTKK